MSCCRVCYHDTELFIFLFDSLYEQYNGGIGFSGWTEFFPSV